MSLGLAALVAAACTEPAPQRECAPASPTDSSAQVELRSGTSTSAAASGQTLRDTALPEAAGVLDGTAIECPAPVTDVDAVLDAGGRSYDAGEFAVALACADIAVDLVPRAVEAQHLRAAALAAEGRYEDAQVAFSMALALDPDDPETLAAAADFFVNILRPKRRQTILVGLEYARRGSERARTRRRLDRSLRGRLMLLEAEALNDLGASDLALPRIEEALEWAPERLDIAHERGVSLFNLLRLEEAEQAFTGVLSRAPDDPYAHYHLGLIYERFGRAGDAAAHLARARELAPTEFDRSTILSPAEFRAEVAEAIGELPADTRSKLAAVALELVDVPARDDLMAADPPFAPTILGLFRGLPLGVEATDYLDGARNLDSHSGTGGQVPPRAIVLYRLNLGRAASTRAELDRQIRRTLLHEVGHLEGLDEDELRRRGLE